MRSSSSEAPGDLAYKKVFPALQGMVGHGSLDVPVSRLRSAFGNAQCPAHYLAEVQINRGGVLRDPGARTPLRLEVDSWRWAGVPLVIRAGKCMPAPDLAAGAEPYDDEVDAYERLLTDAMQGRGLLFVREDAVRSAWARVDPILGDVSREHEYEAGSWGQNERSPLPATLAAGTTRIEGSNA